MRVYIGMMTIMGLTAAVDFQGLWQTMVSLTGGIAMWAQQRRSKLPVDPAQDVTDMLRRPIVWTLRNPGSAMVRLKRKADRRRER